MTHFLPFFSTLAFDLFFPLSFLSTLPCLPTFFSFSFIFQMSLHNSKYDLLVIKVTYSSCCKACCIVCKYIEHHFGMLLCGLKINVLHFFSLQYNMLLHFFRGSTTVITISRLNIRGPRDVKMGWPGPARP